MTKHYFTYLALGDSYTIGEAVPLHESFPYQAVQLLREEGIHIHAPEIVAKTGWTTAELAQHLLHTHLNEVYDFVTLLIGVNNQFRNLSLEDYRTDFDFLVKKAMHLANDNPERVIVFSIPDYSVTPFAASKDTAKIAAAIDAFNAVNKEVAEQYKTHYIEITSGTRLAAHEPSFIAADNLHPSAKEYKKWAEEVADIIIASIKL